MTWIEISKLYEPIGCSISVRKSSDKRQVQRVEWRFSKLLAINCGLKKEPVSIWIGLNENDGFIRMCFGLGSRHVIQDRPNCGFKVTSRAWAQSLPSIPATPMEQLRWDAGKRELIMALPKILRERPYMDDMIASADMSWKVMKVVGK